jgi:hypothetical protein
LLFVKTGIDVKNESRGLLKNKVFDQFSGIKPRSIANLEEKAPFNEVNEHFEGDFSAVSWPLSRNLSACWFRCLARH